jgi:hypothetical protein
MALTKAKEAEPEPVKDVIVAAPDSDVVVQPSTTEDDGVKITMIEPARKSSSVSSSSVGEITAAAVQPIPNSTTEGAVPGLPVIPGVTIIDTPTIIPLPPKKLGLKYALKKIGLGVCC